MELREILLEMVMPALRHEEEAVQAKERQANGKGTGEEEGRGAGNNVKIQKLKPRGLIQEEE